MFTYRLVSPDGDDLCQTTYAQMIRPEEEIVAGRNERFRVLAVVSFGGRGFPAYGVAGSRAELEPTCSTAKDCQGQSSPGRR